MVLTREPTLSSVGQDLYEALRPLAEPYDAARGYPLLRYAGALGGMFQPVEELVRDLAAPEGVRVGSINYAPDGSAEYGDAFDFTHGWYSENTATGTGDGSNTSLGRIKRERPGSAGTWAYELTRISFAGKIGMAMNLASYAVPRGQTITFSAWVYGPKGSSVSLRVNWVPSGGGLSSFSQTFTKLEDEWEEIYIEGSIPSNSTAGRAIVAFDSAPANDPRWVDDIMLYEGHKMPTWNDVDLFTIRVAAADATAPGERQSKTRRAAPGWSRIVSPRTAPGSYLPYIGQFVGVKVPPRRTVVEDLNYATNPWLDAAGDDIANTFGTNTKQYGSTDVLSKEGRPVLKATYNNNSEIIGFDVPPAAYPGPGEYTFGQVDIWIPPSWNGGEFSIFDDSSLSGASMGGANAFTGSSYSDRWQTMWFSRRNDGDTADDWWIGIWTSMAPSVGSVIYFSNLIIKRTKSYVRGPVPFTHGDLPDWYWTGTRMFSASFKERPEDDNEYRARVSPDLVNPQHARRGTVPAIIEAVSDQLTGSKTVINIERLGNNAARGAITTLLSETPVGNTIQAAIDKLAPAGKKITHATTTGETYQALRDTHTDYGDVRSTFVNYQEVLDNPTKQ